MKLKEFLELFKDIDPETEILAGNPNTEYWSNSCVNRIRKFLPISNDFIKNPINKDVIFLH